MLSGNTAGIYPNPTKGNILVTNDSPIGRIQLFDLAGKLMYEATGINQHEYSFDISGFDRGVYLLTVDGIAHKIIKQ